MASVFMGIAVGLAQCVTAVSGLVEVGSHRILAVIVGAGLLAFLASGDNRRALARRRSSSNSAVVAARSSDRARDRRERMSERASTAADDDGRWASVASSQWLHVTLGALIIIAMVVLFAVSAVLLFKSEPENEQSGQWRGTLRMRDACIAIECLDTTYRGRGESVGSPLLRPHQQR